MGTNVFVGVGRLTKDPELRMTQSGTGVCRFTLAIDRIKKVEGQPEADFLTCTAFGKTAEYMSTYLKKGYLVSVEGSIRTGSYDNQQTGQKVYTTEVACNNVQNLTPKPKDEVVTQAAKPQDEVVTQATEDYLDIDYDSLPF